MAMPRTSEESGRDGNRHECDDHSWRRISKYPATRRRCAGRDDQSRWDDFATTRVPDRPLGRLFLGAARTRHADARLIIALIADPGQCQQASPDRQAEQDGDRLPHLSRS